jgi:hypothetical protein
MKKILHFPAQRTRKVLALQKADSQRFFLAMSLFSVVLVAVFANVQSSSALRRAVASVQPLHAFRDLEWEKQIAQKLGQENPESRTPASVAERVSLMDDLRYGPLAGKYRMRSVASEAETIETKLKEIEYVQSDEVTDKPVVLPDTKSFLIKYSGLLDADFANTELAYSKEGEEMWQLLDRGQKVVGRALISTDSNGRLLGIKIERL